MKVYAARQAILNRRLQTVAYELFMRQSMTGGSVEDTPNAINQLISQQQWNQGFRALSRDKPVLIKISEASLLEGVAKLLPPEDTVLELAQDTSPSDEVLQACKQLFHKGYRLAMSHYLFDEAWNPFLSLIRMIRFELPMLPRHDLEQATAFLKTRRGMKLLAAKLNQRSQFELARELGFDYFQGEFFCHPDPLVSQDIPLTHQIVMAIYTEILQEDFSYRRVIELFERDVALSFKLLRFINSGLFQLNEPIGSIRQALVYMGSDSARKFISLVAATHISQDKPSELIRLCTVRARFCELLAQALKYPSPSSAFLCGLFSLLDALLDKPMKDLLDTLPLQQAVRDTLLGEKTDLLLLLELAKAYEAGSWYWGQKWANLAGIPAQLLPEFYQQSLEWASDFEQVSH
ncbi:EAL and HDOD domain-containing protein [Bowmanella dokdonensis]|uniref:HDOD domain-containing protein n=1 Tax=Bowmanella dokdonensis TaxID=751969 RepID=A0A939DKK8_9ALTE|nr:HDOD domain-containing protein [Bowmanella dokdonensis]MBN7824448.1 HDOD domain-containing protein [Bowmanella dokdonensis]